MSSSSFTYKTRPITNLINNYNASGTDLTNIQKYTYSGVKTPVLNAVTNTTASSFNSNSAVNQKPIALGYKIPVNNVYTDISTFCIAKYLEYTGNTTITISDENPGFTYNAIRVVMVGAGTSGGSGANSSVQGTPNNTIINNDVDSDANHNNGPQPLGQFDRDYDNDTPANTTTTNVNNNSQRFVFVSAGDGSTVHGWTKTFTANNGSISYENPSSLNGSIGLKEGQYNNNGSIDNAFMSRLTAVWINQPYRNYNNANSVFLKSQVEAFYTNDTTADIDIDRDIDANDFMTLDKSNRPAGRELFLNQQNNNAQNQDNNNVYLSTNIHHHNYLNHIEAVNQHIHQHQNHQHIHNNHHQNNYTAGSAGTNGPGGGFVYLSDIQLSGYNKIDFQIGSTNNLALGNTTTQTQILQFNNSAVAGYAVIPNSNIQFNAASGTTSGLVYSNLQYGAGGAGGAGGAAVAINQNNETADATGTYPSHGVPDATNIAGISGVTAQGGYCRIYFLVN